MQGRQQQTAIPITQAKAKQKTTKKTSNAKKTVQSLQRKEIQSNLKKKVTLLWLRKNKPRKHWGIPKNSVQIIEEEVEPKNPPKE